MTSNNIISCEEIKKYLPEKYNSIAIQSFDQIDSTNRVAKEFASGGNSLPCLIVADSQTAGRGRLGRSFYSPPGTGIYMSVAVGGFQSPLDAVFITSAAAVAVTDAIFDMTGENACIKWVNDIILDGRKICGILAESQKTPDGFSVVLGVGLNMTTESFPDEILSVAGALDSDVLREKMIAEITKNLLEICENPDDKSYIKKYRERSVVIGKEINFFISGKAESGVAIDVDDSGGLVVHKKTGERITLSTGEITVRIK